MKRVLLYLMLLCLWPGLANAEGLVRLHILAASDSPQDQAMKLAVRDQVLTALAGQGDGDPFSSLHRELPLICQAARQAGFQGPITLQTGWFYFEERQLAGRAYAAGYYPAAKILLGKGEGQNWWGLLNPDLTLAAVGDEETIAWHLPRILSLWLIKADALAPLPGA